MACVWYIDKDPWNIFKNSKLINNPHLLNKNDTLILWGGEDIGTNLYKEKPISYEKEHKPSFRDLLELKCINKAIKLQIPIIGICRGAQLLCVHQKGKLIQHVINHEQNHNIYLIKENQVLKTNSYHHQAMIPRKNAEILAISANKYEIGWIENHIKIKPEIPEIVKWNNIRALGIQGHPEYEDAPQEFIEYTKNLILNL